MCQVYCYPWKRADIDDTDTGYRGVHLKGLYPGPDFQVGCEIQVRTILTDAWSWLSKEYLHHREPTLWTKAMSILSSYLRASDDELQFIRDQVEEKEEPAPDLKLKLNTTDTSPPEEATS